MSNVFQVSSALKFLVVEEPASHTPDYKLRWADSGLTVRVVRGRKMRHDEGLFNEFAAALQFPSYFGENTNAFRECITDLSWLPPQAGYVLVIADPGEVLADLEGGLAWFVGLLIYTHAEWTKPIESGEWWDRPAIPFHVVLECGVDDVAGVSQLWRDAKADVVAFEP